MRAGTIKYSSENGIYPGSFEFYAEKSEINLQGDWQGSVLRSNGATYFDPDSSLTFCARVLRRGWRHPMQRLAKVENLKIEGIYNDPLNGLDYKHYDGVLFDDYTVYAGSMRRIGRASGCSLT